MEKGRRKAAFFCPDISAHRPAAGLPLPAPGRFQLAQHPSRTSSPYFQPWSLRLRSHSPSKHEHERCREW